MSNENKHKNTKTVLRVVGVILLTVGIILLLCGTIPFLQGDTSTFDLNFIGMPLIFVGAVCCMFGFMREVNRYVADENKPVIKDTANYLIDGTRDEVVKTIGQLKAGKNAPVCPVCGTVNESGANFCDHCGAPLSRVCDGCGEVNDGDANFCRKCGKKLS